MGQITAQTDPTQQFWWPYFAGVFKACWFAIEFKVKQSFVLVQL